MKGVFANVSSLLLRSEHAYRRHRYILQNVLIMQAIQVTLYMIENLSPFMGDPPPTMDRHMTTAFAGIPILRVVKLSLSSAN